MTELSDDQVFAKQPEMSDAQVFGDPMPDALQSSVPEAFMDRVRAGQALTRITQATMKGASEGFGQGTPTGLEDETLAHLIDTGIFHDPAHNRASPIQFATEAVALPAAKLWEGLSRVTAATIHGAGGAFGQIVDEIGDRKAGLLTSGSPDQARDEVINAGNWAMIEMGMGRFSRPAATPAGVIDQTVGGLPRPEDFANAAKVLTGEEPRSEAIASATIQHAGKIYEGVNHSAALEKLEKELGVSLDDISDDAVEAGFKTTHGRIVSREEALQIAKREGQHPAEAPRHPDADKPEDDGFWNRQWERNKEKLIAENAEMRAATAADVAQQNLKQMWQEEGIHPAEAVHDAQADAFLAHDITNGRPSKSLDDRLNDLTAEQRGFEQTSGDWIGPKSGAEVDPLYRALRTANSPSYDFDTWNKAAKWAKENDRPDIAQAIVDRLRKRADESSTTPGVSLDSPRYEPIKEGLEQEKAQLQRDADRLENEIGLRANNETSVGGYPMPKEDFDALTETGGAPHSLGAAANTEAPLVSPRVQPASPPGRLAAAFKNAGDTLLDIGRDAQMLTAPMARGTTDSMAMAKDFANSMRRNRWDWSRIDKDIADKFTPEQRARMWTAADEESTSIQLGEPASMREHQGLATLEPAERAAVEELHARAQNAWVRARDLGMVEGEGLPAYTPRMIINAMGAGSKETALALDGIGRNLKTKTANMLKRKYLEAQDTEAAAKARYGDQAMLARDIRVLPLATSQLEDAIAGRSLINNIKDYGSQTGTDTVVEGAIPAGGDKFFTLDHPAFKTWRPKFEDGVAVKDAEGKTIFEQVPIYVHGDFEGPLRAVLSQKSGPLYGAMMSLKGKTMSLIMNSPMIHNAVEWGRALPAMPGKVATFKVYFEGNRAKYNVPLMQEAIDNGLVPIGHRFFNQDISSIMEAPDLTPGRSFTAKVLGFVPGLFDEGAGNAVKGAIDKAGDFWHNTLLWDRIADLQMGLYKNFLDDSVAKGIDRTTASRMAAHWANRYAGALPKEAMSDAATKVANMLMFSRSFTMGNLGVLKDVFTGLPKDVIAQIERDAGFGKGSIAAADETSAAISYAKSMARRKAMSVVGLDIGLMVLGNSLMQNVMNVLFNDSSLDKELHGYAGRMLNEMQEVKEHPLKLLQPLHLLGDVSATSENEPGKGDRVRVGYAKDGTAIYARNPAGKIGDEFVGYMTGPLDMMRKKMGTVARPAWQIMSNDAGFGRKIYDPDADTPAKYVANLGRIAMHLAGSQLPTGQMGAFHDLVTGEGDTKVNAAQAFGPFLGTTFSKGAPGGPAVGEMYAAKTQHDFAVQNAMPDIRKQIQRGDVPGASQRMQDLGIPPGLQRFYVRTTLNPATRLSSSSLRNFYRFATPEQRARMERAQQPPTSP